MLAICLLVCPSLSQALNLPLHVVVDVVLLYILNTAREVEGGGGGGWVGGVGGYAQELCHTNSIMSLFIT